MGCPGCEGVTGVVDMTGGVNKKVAKRAGNNNKTNNKNKNAPRKKQRCHPSSSNRAARWTRPMTTWCK
eukprot:11019862-Prorocentrum_lima.AAC.1